MTIVIIGYDYITSHIFKVGGNNMFY